MIVISKTFSLPQYYDFHGIAPLKDLVFLDIETTGFSPAGASVYLIGAVYHQQMEWHTRQWFSDSLSSEQEILQDFFAFLEGFQAIITYNGDAFDIPFLEKCAQSYGMEDRSPFSRLKSFDLYKKLHPLKKLLGLENLKLTTLEAFLGIGRQNDKNGGEMIAVYRQYLESHNETLYQMLLTHNEEDLKALPQIMPLLSYLEIFSSRQTLAGYSLNAQSASLTIVVDCSVKVPISFTCAARLFSLSVRADQMIIELQAYHGRLKYFFDNYKDYYYLPEEDRAVHKKVGQYVDTDHRRQATAATCYTYKEGYFLPLVTEDMFDIYKPDYTSKQLYTEYIDDADFMFAYVQNLLSDILKGNDP